MTITDTLTLSCNSKTKFGKTHKNTFGLMYGLPENGGTCPGATSGKGGCLEIRDGKKRQTCYMAKIVQIYKAAGAVLKKNTELLENKEDNLKDIIRNTIAQFVKSSPIDQLYFRLNYSGDIYSKKLATAWSEVIQEFPQVQFWVYTRSKLTIIKPLFGIKNLTLFLSCDPSNFDKVRRRFDVVKDKYNNVAMAFMGNDAPEPELYRWVKCPEITGKVKNDDTGACSKCRLCIDNFKIRVKNIQFPIH